MIRNSTVSIYPVLYGLCTNLKRLQTPRPNLVDHQIMRSYLLFGLFFFFGLDQAFGNAEWDEDKPKIMGHVKKLNRQYKYMDEILQDHKKTINENRNELHRREEIINKLVEKDKMKSEEIATLKTEGMHV